MSEKTRTFNDYWQGLKRTDKMKRLQIELQRKLELSLDSILRKKRTEKFNKLERAEICRIVNKLENTSEYTEAGLFPNSVEQFA